MTHQNEKAPEYLTSQIITYMGNKRKVLPHIEELLLLIKGKLGKDKLNIGDGFAGIRNSEPVYLKDTHPDYIRMT